MSKKWTNRNLAGALHFVTGNVQARKSIFTKDSAAIAFYEELQELKTKREAKIIAHVVMPDHIHLVVNPRDGDIRSWTGALKSLSAKRIIPLFPSADFSRVDENKVWQESFKSLALWSGWMMWQKINYIHNNPVNAGLVRTAKDYRWTSFRNFYGLDDDPLLAVDPEWHFEGDLEKVRKSLNKWGTAIAED